MRQVPLNDLARFLPGEHSQIERTVMRLVASGSYVLGESVQELEAALAIYLGAEHVISCGNGTDALELALRSIGVERGDLVAAAAHAGGYSSTALAQIGATPVFIDCDAHARMDIESLRSTLQRNPRISAVVVTHLYGLTSDIEAIASICKNEGLALVEDCAQSIGAFVDGRAVGTFGDVATFSFYPTKNLGALGDGGAVATSSEEKAQKIRALRQYGWSSKYVSEIPFGKNSRLDEIQAAVLGLRLPYLDASNDKRRDIWRIYSSSLPSQRWYLIGDNDPSFVAHLGVLVTPSGTRDSVELFLRNHGVSTSIHYPLLDYQQPAWREFASQRCTNAEDLVTRILTIPLFPTMTDYEVAQVAEALSRLDEVVQ